MPASASASADIAKTHRRLDRLALKPDPIIEVESRDSLSGALSRWKRTRAATELTRGVRTFFLELAGERPRSATTSAAPITGLDHVVVSTEDPERAAALYGARLGLDMALDRSHQDWGQLMFFRCGDLMVEVVRRPVAGADQAHDRLWGLSWRVADIDATRARLSAAGIDVSEVRIGRKPGTRVVTVRGGTCGVQTLLLERTARGERVEHDPEKVQPRHARAKPSKGRRRFRSPSPGIHAFCVVEGKRGWPG